MFRIRLSKDTKDVLKVIGGILAFLLFVKILLVLMIRWKDDKAETSNYVIVNQTGLNHAAVSRTITQTTTKA